jgi:hypothetical protein
LSFTTGRKTVVVPRMADGILGTLLALKHLDEMKVLGAAMLGTHALGYALTKSHLHAHTVPQLLGFVALAYVGTLAWFGEGQYKAIGLPWGSGAAGGPSYPSIHASSEFGTLCAALQLPFQAYEILCALGVKELRGKSYEMLLHHVFAFLLSWLCVSTGTYSCYGGYFLGVTEYSSVPLVFVDALKRSKATAAK